MNYARLYRFQKESPQWAEGTGQLVNVLLVKTRSYRAVADALGLCLFTVAVLFWRRPDQFIYPSIWDEGGTVVLKAYAEHGWSSLFEPVNGYFILSTKLISLAAFQLSILDAPRILLWLTVAFTCAVVLAIRFSPTYLYWPLLCAIAVLLVPTDGEVFAVELYSFWWAGLLLLLALAWSGNESSGWRYAYLVIGGFSSPIILPVAACSVLRALIEARPSQFLFSGVACAIAAVQFGMGMSSTALVGTIEHFFDVATITGVPIMLLCLLFGWQFYRGSLHSSFYLLGIVGILVAMMVAIRLAGTPHPIVAGPRYFFYPYVICMWLGIWLAATTNSTPVRSLLALAMITGIAAAIQFKTMSPYAGFRRHHAPIDWSAAIEECASANGISHLPIQYDGDPAQQWRLDLYGSQCRALLAQSIL